MMDSHDVGRGRGGVERALASVRQPALVASVSSDALYVPAEQRALARWLPAARLVTIASAHGHDAFLIEGEQLNALLVSFRRDVERAWWSDRRCAVSSRC
jgi:homoserine O-acetyltransferase